jgi:hypothetical protein
MHFLSDKSLQYQSVDSSEDGRESTFESERPKNHDGISRLALLSIIFIAQVLVLASTNTAAYAFGKIRAEANLKGTSHTIQNSIIGDSSSTYAYHDF